MAIDISDALVAEARDMLDERGSTDSVRYMLTTVLAMPEVRQAIHDDVRRETEQKLRDMGVTGYSVEYDR
jgi:GH18 family chitinase